MSETRGMSEAVLKDSKATLQSDIPKTTAWKDFLALIKVGIVNSNIITAFTGVWLAIHFAGLSFFSNLDVVFYTLAGSALIMAGSCSFNNYYDRDIDHLMERTKNRPTVTGKAQPSRVLFLSFGLIITGLILLALTNMTTAIDWGVWRIRLCGSLYDDFQKKICFEYHNRQYLGSGPTPDWMGSGSNPNLDVIAWVLFAIMFLWQPPHFYALAMRRVEEYRAAGVPMLPVVKGFKRAKKSIIVWIIALMFIPFFLTPLGTPLVVLAALLSTGWLILGLKGYKKKDDIKWATSMFVYSLNYMTILFVAMVIVTLI